MEQSKIETLNTSSSKTEIFLLKLLENKNKVLKLISLLALFLIFLFAALMIKDHFKAKQLVDFQKNIQVSDNQEIKSQLKPLKKLANRYPHLQPQLDATLAQQHLNLGQFSQAKNFLQRVEKRQKSFFPLLKQLNEMAFLTEQKQNRLALALGYDLKAQLKNSPSLSSLYTFHLIRLLELEKKMGHKKEVQKLIEEIKQQPFCSAFELGKLNLMDYCLHENHSSAL